MRRASVPAAGLPAAVFSIRPRRSLRLFSYSSSNEPQLDWSAGISTVFSHLPFRYS
jgi:hypothetical protein